MQAKRTRHCASGGTFEMCVARQTMFHVWLNASRGNVLWQVALSSKPMRGTSEKLAKNKVAVPFRQVKMETLLLQQCVRHRRSTCRIRVVERENESRQQTEGPWVHQRRARVAVGGPG